MQKLGVSYSLIILAMYKNKLDNNLHLKCIRCNLVNSEGRIGEENLFRAFEYGVHKVPMCFFHGFLSITPSLMLFMCMVLLMHKRNVNR